MSVSMVEPPRFLVPGMIPKIVFPCRVNPFTGREWYDAEQVDDVLDACERTITALATDNARMCRTINELNGVGYER